MSERQDNAILTGPILSSLLKFAIPVLLALFLQALYGAVDLWAVGTFCGSADVSAVSIGSQTMLIVTGIITGLSMGTTIWLGQKLGEKNDQEAADAVGSSIWIFAILGLILTVVMLCAAPLITEWMNTPTEAVDKTLAYIRICGAGTLCIVAYNVMSGIFRGLGNSRAPLLFVFIACMVNMVGDVILIKFFHMGTAGAAIATIFAQAVSVVCSLILIGKKGFPFAIHKRNLRFSKESAKHMVGLGAPIAFQEMCNEISFLVLIGLVNILGVTASAGVGIAERLVMFILLVPTSYMSSISVFVAQNTGAGQKERAQKGMWMGMMTAALLGGFLAYISFFHGDVLSSLFIQDAAVIGASAEFLKATAIECFILSLTYCFTGYFNGMGKTIFVMGQNLCAIFLVRIPYAYYASHKPEPYLFDIGLSAILAAAFMFVVCTGYYLWERRTP